MSKMRRRQGRERSYDSELALYHRESRKKTERFAKLKVGAKVKNVISQKIGRFEGLIRRNHPFIMVTLTSKRGHNRSTVWYVDNVSTKVRK